MIKILSQRKWSDTKDNLHNHYLIIATNLVKIKLKKYKKKFKKNISGSPVTFTHTSDCAEGWIKRSIDGTNRCFKYAGAHEHVDAMEKCCEIGGIVLNPMLGWD